MSERDFKGPASRCTPLRSVLDVEGDNLFVVQSRLEETTEVTLTETRFRDFARELVKINRRPFSNHRFSVPRLTISERKTIVVNVASVIVATNSIRSSFVYFFFLLIFPPFVRFFDSPLRIFPDYRMKYFPFIPWSFRCIIIIRFATSSIKFTIESRAIDYSFDARIRCTRDWMSRFIKNVLMNKFLTTYRGGRGKVNQRSPWLKLLIIYTHVHNTKYQMLFVAPLWMQPNFYS